MRPPRTSCPAPPSFSARVERKNRALPCYVVVPARRAAELGIRETAVVEVRLDGVAVGRRTLKRWDDERWFFDLTAAMLRRAEVSPGDRVTVSLHRASERPPAELGALLESSPAARRAWESLSRSRRRLLSEHVRDAKTSATRRRRAEKLLTERGA